MKNLLLISLIFIGFIIPAILESQTRYPTNYFRSPVDFPILLAGGFGDVRQNHFHSGIDIRTNGEEGKPVYAVADGYVSRINISSTGFGKALYITHPNGYTTVYGHLKNLNGSIGRWIKEQQYKRESFEIDIPVDPGILKVKKGDIIAYSGNTGLSEGPHLHFEIRDASSQEIIDPFLFGLPFKDSTPPKIYNVRIYPFDENSRVNYSENPLTLAVTGSGNECRLISKDTVRVSGKIIFGVQTLDFSNDTGSRGGIASIELYVDTTICFAQQIERFAFAETRYANTVLDYPQVVKNGQRIMRSYIAPNNKLSMYGKNENSGIMNFMDAKLHRVLYVIKDAFGNTSKLAFSVRSYISSAGAPHEDHKAEGTLLTCGKNNHFSSNGLAFDLPVDALYEDLDFIFSSTPAIHGSFSPVYHLQNDLIPLHSACTLNINTDGVPKTLLNKALIVKVEPNGHFSGRSSRLENNYITTQVREFGNYTIAVDTTLPVIRPLNVSQNKNVSRQQSLAFKISDNLSGIRYYRGTLNGEWILMDFDAKDNLLVYNFDNRIKPGKNIFRLVVRDAVGNERIYHATLTR